MRSYTLLATIILAFLASASLVIASSPIEATALLHRSATDKAERRARVHGQKNHHRVHRKRKSCKAKGLSGKTKSNGLSGANNVTVDDDGAGVKRGICWGMDDRYANQLEGSKLSWYHHWQDGPVSGLNAQGAEYVPMFWGARHSGLWNQRKASFGNRLPKHIIAQNEPDVKSQANVDPYTAAADWARELGPYQKKGVKITTPQIVYDVNWMGTFYNELKKKGYTPDIVALHWYGGSNQIDSFKAYIQKVHSRFPNQPIWITEMGVTRTGAGSQSEVLQFQREVMSFVNSVGYVKRVAWIGAFVQGQAYDNFMSNLNGFFHSGGIQGWARYFLFGSSSKRDIFYEEAERHAASVSRDVVDVDAERDTTKLFVA
ncbi:hypothetical protein CF327_g972 [Tilletia walkeri]|uniref:Asl1-like glycosyl hydrolase catalytic domain-containing protein n=1 Tax=Tilletia walkeri TaxID=117179 RepID=A0A8X7N7K7_9BASI|nr:hypothetical protein CF327_g972 [Tilletia walkeri]KAE8268129.1 hypothetical protein A4X09_0g4212 [Tilletia walkeri]